MEVKRAPGRDVDEQKPYHFFPNFSHNEIIKVFQLKHLIYIQ